MVAEVRHRSGFGREVVCIFQPIFRCENENKDEEIKISNFDIVYANEAGPLKRQKRVCQVSAFGFIRNKESRNEKGTKNHKVSSVTDTCVAVLVLPSC
jgi:hypothetical protein